MFQNVKREHVLKSLERLFLSFVFLSFFLHSRFFINSFDVWWHLKTGQVILENQMIPRTDIYSHTVFGTPWLNHQWGTQVIFYSLYKVLGLEGLLIFKGLFIVTTFIILYKLLKLLTNNKYLAIAVTILCFECSSLRFVLRPDLISAFFLCLFIAILYAYKLKKCDLLWALPLLMILWINAHASALLGCAVIFLFIFCEFVQKKFIQRHSQPFAPQKLLLVALFVVLASFVNIYGYRLHLFSLYTQSPLPF